DRLTTRLSATPTLQSVAPASELPAANSRRLAYEIEGRVPATAELRDTVSTFTISPAYFETLGATIRRGRDFNRFDHAFSPLVAIVNQRFVDAVWRGEDPVGKRVRLVDGAASDLGPTGAGRGCAPALSSAARDVNPGDRPE